MSEREYPTPPPEDETREESLDTTEATVGDAANRTEKIADDARRKLFDRSIRSGQRDESEKTNNPDDNAGEWNLSDIEDPDAGGFAGMEPERYEGDDE